MAIPHLHHLKSRVEWDPARYLTNTPESEDSTSYHDRDFQRPSCKTTNDDPRTQVPRPSLLIRRTKSQSLSIRLSGGDNEWKCVSLSEKLVQCAFWEMKYDI